MVAAAGALSADDPPSAKEIATWVWKRLENPSIENEPLILIAENGNACVARLNVENVTGVFVYDEDLA